MNTKHNLKHFFIHVQVSGDKSNTLHHSVHSNTNYVKTFWTNTYFFCFFMLLKAPWFSICDLLKVEHSGRQNHWADAHLCIFFTKKTWGWKCEKVTHNFVDKSLNCIISHIYLCFYNNLVLKCWESISLNLETLKSTFSAFKTFSLVAGKQVTSIHSFSYFQTLPRWCFVFAWK